MNISEKLEYFCRIYKMYIFFKLVVISYLNERFQKEKKAWEQKEDATKVALRVSQDRIKLIEEKLKKVMQKGEKI
jgi:hypothetical protein